MTSTFKIFLDLATLFKKHGFNLYLVGGASREFLLGEEITEFDCATDATAEEMETFLIGASFVFRKYGTVTHKLDGYRFEITTLRKEKGYINYRYPDKITFVKTIGEDYVRRDFTINALYIDAEQNVYDFTNGQKDLEQRILRMIGNPYERLNEDPLRIIRGLRFVVKLNLTIEENLSKAIFDSKHLLKNLNKEKILFEYQKVNKSDKLKFLALLKQYEIEILK